MGAPFTAAGAGARLKREDCRRTRHDSAFSKWKILIGPSDWEDHWLNKDGAARYRVQNLPAVPDPGVYEIGVAVWDWPTGSGRDVGKLDPDRIVVVYLGQAENVRSRLQRYGRGGAHLDKGISWAEELNTTFNGSGPGSVGLFKEIFARGLPIVYRWALMSSKKDAERTEAELLARFDYAWNKVGNVTKRPTDALLKIDEVSSRNVSAMPKVLEKLRSLTEKKVGIPIRANVPSSPNKVCHDGSDEGADTEGNRLSLFARVFKFGRSQPRMVVPHDDDEALQCQTLAASSVCGVTLADGSVCTNEAVEGRKRCPEHKGKKKFAGNGTGLNSPSKQTGAVIPYLQDDVSVEKPIVDGVEEELFVPICGVILLNGSPCTKKPAMGRKRCDDHKGRKIQQLKPPKLSYQEASGIDIDARLDRGSMSSRNLGTANDGKCCGVILSSGSCCKRLPVKGRKRCEEHKGMRIYGCLSH